jgi:beta-glucanase (GH16 family)
MGAVMRWHLALAFVPMSLAAVACGASPSSEAVDDQAAQVSAGQIFNFGTIAHPGSCMDAQAGGTQNGTQVQEWTCNGTGAQSYRLDDAGGGAFKIVNTQANRCVDVNARGTANGTKIQLWDCNGTPAQSFFARDAGNGFVNFVSTNSNKCLDVAAAGTADGTLIQLYDCNGTNAQRFNPTVIGAGGGAGGGGSSPPSPPPTSGWKLTWSDEFDGPNGSAVDGSKWSYDVGGSGWGNQELEYYTSGTSNAVIENGMLAITATQDGASSHSCWYGPCQYTSARINTAGKFAQQYGRFEARIQIPEGQGVWPAFWMLGQNIGNVGWPQCGEIDIMENIGRTPDSTYGTTHGPGPGNYPGAGLSGAFNGGQPMGNGFHVYATEWDAQAVKFIVDGSVYWTVTRAQLPAGATWVWDQPFFVILNFAVGGGWPGNPDGSTSFPKQMLVDYVRVYAAQ